MTLLDFPETLSRVTLALLGSVFQTNLSDIRQVFKSARNRNNDQTENSVSYNIWHLENSQTSLFLKTLNRENINRRKRHVFSFVFSVGLFSVSFMTCFPAPTNELYL